MKLQALPQKLSRLWPVSVLVIGIGLSALLGNVLQRQAVETWQKRANQEATQQSIKLLSWVEESYSMLSALVALVENSGKVDADEFLNAVDGLEARAKVNFVSVKAMFEMNKVGWRTKYSSIPGSAESPIPSPDRAPSALLLDTLTLAQDTPNEWFMSAPFADANGKQQLYVVLVPTSKSNFALAGVLSVERMLDNLVEGDKLTGMSLDLKLNTEGRDAVSTLSSAKLLQPSVHHTTTLTQTAHTNLELDWQFSNAFDGGVDLRLSRGVFGGGSVLAVLIALFVANMRRQHRHIQHRVDEATRELAIALKEAEAATIEKGNMLGNLEQASSELASALAKAEEAAVERGNALLELEASTQRLAQENVERLKSDQRTRLILNSASEGIFGVDADERGTFFNSTASKLLGYSSEEMAGQVVHALIHHAHDDGTPLPAEQRPMHVACSTGKPAKLSGEALWRKDGTWFPSEYSVTPIVDDKGSAAGAVVVFRDITEQRKNQEELQTRMDELERFNRLNMGREVKMIALKEEINSLLESMGKPRKYKNAGIEALGITRAETTGGAA